MADVTREFISMNDVSQYEDEAIVGYRGEVDANAAVPPLPHDVYLFNVTYAEQDPDKRWMKKLSKDNQVFFMAFIKVESKNNANPAHDGRSWQENVMTLVNKRGVTGVQALLQGLGVDTLMLNTHGAQIKALDGVLAGGDAMVGMETDWQARIFDKDAPRLDKSGQPVIVDGKAETGQEKWQLKGMRNFPKIYDAEGKETGEYSHVIGKDDGYAMKDGTPIVDEVRAFNIMRRWCPVGSVSAATTEEVTEDAGTPAPPAAPPVPPAAPKPAAAPTAPPPPPPAPTATRPAGRPAPPVRRVQG